MSSSADVKPTVPIPQEHADDEQLDISPESASAALWQLRIPKFLHERWERVLEPGVELGQLLIDTTKTPFAITLRLPDTSLVPLTGADAKDGGMDVDEGGNAEAGPSSETSAAQMARRPPIRYDTSGIPDEYDVDVPIERAKNLWVFSERVRTWAEMGTSRDGALKKRKPENADPTLVGQVAHECTVKPKRSEKYMRILEERRREGEMARRPIIQLKDTDISQGKLNQMASGFGNANSTFGKDFVTRTDGRSADKATRLPRAELIDKLFGLFSQKPYWSITALRQQTQQPDQYLREILQSIAASITEGEYRGLWELKGSFKTAGDPGVGRPDAAGQGASRSAEDDEQPKSEVGGEEDEGEDDDDDEDFDDFEEVME